MQKYRKNKIERKKKKTQNKVRKRIAKQKKIIKIKVNFCVKSKEILK